MNSNSKVHKGEEYNLRKRKRKTKRERKRRLKPIEKLFKKFFSTVLVIKPGPCAC
jgi:hypothetical protein